MSNERLRVLLIDTDEAEAQLVREALDVRADRFELVVATTLEQAIARLTASAFDVALLDTETVHVFGAVPTRWQWGDEGGAGSCDALLPDGHLDAALTFRTQDLIQGLSDRGALEDGGEMMLQLEGATTDGTPFAGEDMVTLQVPDKGERGGGSSARSAGRVEDTAPVSQDRSNTAGRTFGKR